MRTFAKEGTIFRPYEISSSGIQPDPEKLESLNNYTFPANKMEMQRYSWFSLMVP